MATPESDRLHLEIFSHAYNVSSEQLAKIWTKGAQIADTWKRHFGDLYHDE